MDGVFLRASVAVRVCAARGGRAGRRGRTEADEEVAGLDVPVDETCGARRRRGRVGERLWAGAWTRLSGRCAARLGGTSAPSLCTASMQRSIFTPICGGRRSEERCDHQQ